MQMVCGNFDIMNIVFMKAVGKSELTAMNETENITITRTSSLH